VFLPLQDGRDAVPSTVWQVSTVTDSHSDYALFGTGWRGSSQSWRGEAEVYSTLLLQLNSTSRSTVCQFSSPVQLASKHSTDLLHACTTCHCHIWLLLGSSERKANVRCCSAQIPSSQIDCPEHLDHLDLHQPAYLDYSMDHSRVSLTLTTTWYSRSLLTRTPNPVGLYPSLAALQPWRVL
jgi:hypothetical protein